MPPPSWREAKRPFCEGLPPKGGWRSDTKAPCVSHRKHRALCFLGLRVDGGAHQGTLEAGLRQLILPAVEVLPDQNFFRPLLEASARAWSMSSAHSQVVATRRASPSSTVSIPPIQAARWLCPSALTIWASPCPARCSNRRAWPGWPGRRQWRGRPPARPVHQRHSRPV